MQDLTITLVQSTLEWQNIDANLRMMGEKIVAIQKTDLIVLPEMFTTGFTMEAERLAEVPRGKSADWMLQMSEEKNTPIIGSIIVKENNNYYNRLHCAFPDGRLDLYDKRHLFRMAEEHHYFNSGKKRLVIEINGWNIMPQVCYDLRFPVWNRNRSTMKGLEYDLILFVANWPAARIRAWDSLLKARAVENLAYAAGVNRVGTDGNNINYNGHSGCYGPKGETIYFSGEVTDISSITLDHKKLLNYRQKFPAFRDADSFSIDI